MTREEAIALLRGDAFKVCAVDLCEQSCEDCYEALYMAIEALEQQPKWISVTESLPEEGLTVLIFAEGGEIEFGQRDENKWEWLAESIADYWTEAEGVIAWQPLPKRYEESDGE